MKKILMAVVAVAVAAMAGSAMAADTATVSVNANVIGTCKFNRGGSITYVNLDPASAATTVTGTVTQQPQFWCTKNASYNITDDKGLHESGAIFQMQHTTLADVIPYTFTYTATGNGAGIGSPITMNIASTINVSDLANVAGGDYSDTVTLTIAP